MPVQTWSSTVDWICVGSGAGGCAAALAGQAQGLTVLLVERSAVIGGTTAQSGGILWAPMNYLQQEAGLADSRQEALAYLRYTGAGENGVAGVIEKICNMCYIPSRTKPFTAFG